MCQGVLKKECIRSGQTHGNFWTRGVENECMRKGDIEYMGRESFKENLRRKKKINGEEELMMNVEAYIRNPLKAKTQGARE